MNTIISSAGPSITQSDIDLVAEAVRDGWHGKMNLYVEQFTHEFSNYIGTKYCLPTAHCTDAIHLALLALDIGPGDEVIVPDLTWVASAAPVCYVGAKPVFADIDPDSWCVTAESIERCITPRSKAVMVVDLLGNMPEWSEIRELCESRGLHIIEDAAEGLGATYNGEQAGTFGDISLFSFNATKLIMSGQGGALCTNSRELYEKAKLFSHHGIDKELTGKYYWSNVIGHNYNWTNIQAALALSQLRRIEDLINYKRNLFQQYQVGLMDIPGVQLSTAKPNVQHSFWITVAIPDRFYNLPKEEMGRRFAQEGIDLRPLFYPLSAMPAFRKYLPESPMDILNPVTYEKSRFGVCLPSGNNLVRSDIERICDLFRRELMRH
jgi:perosamine synthetase